MTETKFVGTPRKAATHVNQNEGLIFQKSSPGKKAYRLADAGCARHRRRIPAGREARAQRPRRNAGAIGDRNHPPLHASLHLELCHRSRHVSAGLVHDEVQPARERGWWRASRAWPRRTPTSRRRWRRAACEVIDAAASTASSRSPAWTPSRCSRRPARTASSPASCSSAPGTSRSGNPRKKILIPDSAHGTNPAPAAAICGYAGCQPQVERAGHG